ncbi:ferredoxin reductase [Hymenobacter sp. BT186]|uniref:Ferredoxin reductase n=1 Tax=Hymenobacter telluris TaxID=2816474 RepID=A0A939EUY6_9BACT|nr:ferredoxin reductase [Hymenobacter telluris]MBO0357918.1 ferredoxin reductase [Hymenobacter telluris]MBW3373945.1 ferredoxin reductase [Hymenobacter norwichensis]
MSRLDWQIGTVVAIKPETPRVKTYTLRLPHWTPHRAGQHYDLRLTAPDGYQTERSYSIASPPEQTGEIELTVELIEEGEVSGYLFEGVAVGDQLEVRGPIGGYFVWPAKAPDAPLLLVGGGSGVVPLMAMLRHRQRAGLRNPVVLLFSVRSPEEVIYQNELEAQAQTDPAFTLLLTYTRQAPANWTGYQRRLDAAMLTEAVAHLPGPPQCYICGPTGLVESAATLLQAQGLPDDAIRTERFGPTGS